jgi:hypothetical protein
VPTAIAVSIGTLSPEARRSLPVAEPLEDDRNVMFGLFSLEEVEDEGARRLARRVLRVSVVVAVLQIAVFGVRSRVRGAVAATYVLPLA